MPEIILLYPRVSHPDTDGLLHGEGRNTQNWKNWFGRKGKDFICQERNCDGTKRDGKIHQNSCYYSSPKFSCMCHLLKNCLKDTSKTPNLTKKKSVLKTFSSIQFNLHNTVVLTYLIHRAARSSSHNPQLLQTVCQTNAALSTVQKPFQYHIY